MSIPSKDQIQRQVEQFRTVDRGRPPGVAIEPVGPGEESVWDFPRPPELQKVEATLRVVFNGRTVAETSNGRRIIETSGAPVYYFPPEDVSADLLDPVPGAWSVCEWKGVAIYYDLSVEGKRSERAAFAYPEPLTDLGQGYERIAGHLAFYASRVDAALIGEEQVTPQPGGFYAGWVTKSLRGPIKGAPGSEGW